MVLLLFVSINTTQASPCLNNNWQPTFVHDLDNEDGPWYVTAGGQFVKLRIVDNWDWVPHACDLINQGSIRDTRGFTNCRQYTRIQCGCRRGLSEPNSTCARFLEFHTGRSPTLPYQQTDNNPDVMITPNPVMARNNCTCEDWDNNGRFGVVLNNKVLRSNVGSYSKCIEAAESLKECRDTPDVLVSPNPVMRRGIIARVIQRDECIYRSGGYPSKRSNYMCRIKYSLLNTTNEDIWMTSGRAEQQNIVTGNFETHGLNYRTISPGENYIGSYSCIIPHNRNIGILRMWGTGHHQNNPDREQFQWRLEVQCRHPNVHK